MFNQEIIRHHIHNTFSEIHYLIRLLYATTDFHTKNLHLNQLWNKVSNLQWLIKLLESKTYPVPPPPAFPAPPAPPMRPLPPTQQPVPDLRTITREQLSKFNGKNGYPAYVAVGNTVYDVTNNAAWSAATHFGLTAGKDLTQEFASCHAGQQWILNTLKPVGRLVS
ncbi:cytochrome b5 domain-containing protein [Laceyella putida]|uniref:Cytochrome b5 domain-containing protein n=1 Tax=Laceyella putida TaxID=110101 RepID=A0ABW2RPH4_9BACL